MLYKMIQQSVAKPISFCAFAVGVYAEEIENQNYNNTLNNVLNLVSNKAYKFSAWVEDQADIHYMWDQTWEFEFEDDRSETSRTGTSSDNTEL